MTAAIRARIKNLDDQFSRTLEAFTQRHFGGAKSPELPEPQVMAVSLSGRILTAAQVKVRRTSAHGAAHLGARRCMLCVETARG